MKLSIQKNNRLLSVCAVLCGMAIYSTANTKVADDQADASAQASNESNAQKAQPVRGKKLTSPEIGALNAALEAIPLTTFKMMMAYNKALKISQELDSNPTNDPEVFAQQIRSILDPVKEFFNMVHDYAYMVIPLVEESLLTAQMRSEGSEKRHECLILKFFETKADADKFFSEHVKDKESIKKACHEFTTFFRDLQASLSERAVQAYKKIVAEIKLHEQNKKQSLL